MTEELITIERDWGIPRTKGEWKPIREGGDLVGAEIGCPCCNCCLEVRRQIVTDPESGESRPQIDPETGEGCSIECPECGETGPVKLVGWDYEVKKGQQRPGSSRR